MALPRRCSKCKCYIAPQLLKCPQCRAPAPAVKNAAATKEERAAKIAKEEAKLPVIRRKKVKWKPSTFAIEAHRALEQEIKRKIGKAESARLRNALRSELRVVRATLKRGEQKGSFWRHEFQYELSGSVPVLISPKGRKYVIAEKDEPATLLMESRKHGLGMMRLVRFEQSAVYGRIQLEKKIAKQAMQKAVAKAKDKKTKAKAKDAEQDGDTLL